MGTEQRDTEAAGAYAGIDTWPDDRILEALVEGQERAIAAVRRAIPAISRAAAAVAERLAGGGRLVYAGAGTSIRIAVQDGSELPATFGMAEDRIALSDRRRPRGHVRDAGRCRGRRGRWRRAGGGLQAAAT